MRIWTLSVCLLAFLAVGVVGCGTLTDALNRRAAADVSEADLRLRQDVLNRLRDDAVTSLHNIGVESRNGMVTVYGSVPDDMTRRRVLSVVRGTPGVAGINDRLAR